jgi:hypothetical protein
MSPDNDLHTEESAVRQCSTIIAPFGPLPPGQRAAQVALRLLRACWPALLGVVVYLCLCAWLWRYAEAASGNISIDETAIDVEVPEWLEHRYEDVQRIRNLGKQAEGKRLLDDKLPATMAAAYARNPWVKQVKNVRRVFPSSIQVALDIREPYASVHTGADNKFHVVDADGIRLPIPPSDKPYQQLPVVVMPDAAAPPAGEAFPQRAVNDAVTVIALARGAMQELPASDALIIDGVQVGSAVNLGRHRRNPLVLICRTRDGHQTQVIWGLYWKQNETPLYPLLKSDDKLKALGEHLGAIAQTGRHAEYISVERQPTVHKLAPPPARSSQ